VAGGDLHGWSVPARPADEPVPAPWYAVGARLLLPLRAGAPRSAAHGPPDGDGELIGVWALGTRRPGDLLDHETLAALARVCRHAAVLLDYDRLHHERVKQAVARHELLHAMEIQRQLLPAALPGWPGQLELAARFRPARETSGDFYDVVGLTPMMGAAGRGEGATLAPLQIAMGDVAGKGIAAALVMALARATLRAVAQTALQPSPAATLGLVGGLLYQDVGRRDFVACALAVVEPPGTGATAGSAGPSFRLANAAQVPPLLCRDGRAEELQPPGERLPLGVLPDPLYEELVVDLLPGDVVVFASDGLPEAPRCAAASSPGAGTTPGEMFGFARLHALATSWAARASTAEEVAAGMWADMESWCGTASEHDDMTLLVVRVPTKEQQAHSAALHS
jgi:serine phosphatase RsbU (regulator of sigma subunit)